MSQKDIEDIVEWTKTAEGKAWLREIVIETAGRVLMDTVLDLLHDDPHQWSTRPCPTCGAVSRIVGRPFGCSKRALEKR